MKTIVLTIAIFVDGMETYGIHNNMQDALKLKSISNKDRAELKSLYLDKMIIKPISYKNETKVLNGSIFDYVVYNN